jgi:hypothetical protein
MKLIDILNDPTLSKQISKNIDKKLSSKEFWKKDEEIYLKTIQDIKQAHLNIQMTPEKYHKLFHMPFQ